MCSPGVDELSMMTYLSQFPSAKLKPGAPLRPRTNPSRVRAYGPGNDHTDTGHTQRSHRGHTGVTHRSHRACGHTEVTQGSHLSDLALTPAEYELTDQVTTTDRQTQTFLLVTLLAYRLTERV